MSDERFTIDRATGVDLHLAVAGPGSRSYAFVIDWHIRFLAALAWLIVAIALARGGLSWRTLGSHPSGPLVLGVLMPPLSIYFLYHPLVELFMRGQTPGKRMAGVRVVDRQGAVPGIGAIMIRNVFRLVDSLPVMYAVGLLTAFATAQRVRVGDLAAGTLLVMEQRTVGNFLGRAAGDDPDLLTRDLAGQILERWPALASDKRASLARSLIERTAGAAEAERCAALGDGALRDFVAALAQGSKL